MNASVQAVLSDDERLLVVQTESAELAPLDEDAAIDLQVQIRRQRNKFVGQYRKGASAGVVARGGRGKARPENWRAALKAEAFEEALSRVSRRVAVLARQSAAELRGERLKAARAAKPGAKGPGKGPDKGPGSTTKSATRRTGPQVRADAASDRVPRTPAAKKRRATTRATGAKRQAKRDSR